MWIRACRDPRKDWIQMRYCITEDDIKMDMRDWPNEFKIPVLDQEVPQGMDVDVGKAKTHVGDNATPKKLKPTQNPMHQKEGGPGEKDTKTTKKDAQ
jgi:hypothetical protein